MSEATYINTMIDQFGIGGKTFAMVGDTYNIFEFCKLLGTDPGIKQKIIDNGELGGFVVVRPDSGDPATVVVECLRLLDEYFGHTVNSKGFKVLNNVRVIQGDGINHQSIQSILFCMKMAGYSIDNVALGQGGALLQIVNRDDQKFAMKASAACVNGEWRDVYKDPITDSGKRSMKGRVKLYHTTDGYFSGLGDGNNGLVEVLEDVYENGALLRDMTFDQVRANSNL